MITRGSIIEVPFELPGGNIKRHPALAISDEIRENTGSFVYVVLISTENFYPKYTIRITSEMLNRPMPQDCYFVTHLIDRIDVNDVMNNFGTFVKADYFDDVFIKIMKNAFGYDLEFVL